MSSPPQRLAIEARRVLTDAGIAIPPHNRLVRLALRYLDRAPDGGSPEQFATYVTGVLGKQPAQRVPVIDPNSRRRINHVTDPTGNEAVAHVMAGGLSGAHTQPKEGHRSDSHQRLIGRPHQN